MPDSLQMKENELMSLIRARSTRGMIAFGLSTAATIMPNLAAAHSGLADSSGFAHEFGHPFSGIDHVLAMTTVGMLAYKIGGRGLWLVPLAFVLAMTAGGALGMLGAALPWVEGGIAVSVVVIGAILGLGIKPSAALTAVTVALFAVFHGHAHGAEMPQTYNGVSLAFGFIAATAFLHLIGIGLGSMLARLSERGSGMLMRTTGGTVAVAGLGLLTGLI